MAAANQELRPGRSFLLLAVLTALLPGLCARAANSPISANPDGATGSVLNPTYSVGSWMWARETFDKQTCRFWRSFAIPASGIVEQADLNITADNEYHVFLDGREIGRGGDYRTLSTYDLTRILGPGPHTLAVEAFNDTLSAGVLLGLRVKLSDASVIEIGSDSTWRVVTKEISGWKLRRRPLEQWPTAVVVTPFLARPWARRPDHLARVAVEPLPPVRVWQTVWFQGALFATFGLVVLIYLQLAAKLALQAKAQRLLRAERARFARDIHDDLGAGLTQLLLTGEVALREYPEGSPARVQFEQLCDQARDLSTTMDEVVWAVNSRHDTLSDFATYMFECAQAFLQNTPIRCRLDVETDIPAIAFELPVRRNLFRAVKEALTNAVRHSKATELFLSIHRQGPNVLVVVRDNGQGFDPGQVGSRRNGLKNMAQRMAEVGGGCEVISQPGGGCRILFRAPLAASERWFRRWFSRASGRDSGRKRTESAPAIARSQTSGARS